MARATIARLIVNSPYEEPARHWRYDRKRRLIVTLNMTRVVQHIWEAIRHENTERLEPVFDRDRPILGTSDMRTWYTGKPCEPTACSHINFCVFDSTWEATEAFVLDRAPEVAAWVKNDHLGFEVFYVHRGVVRKYRPDFLTPVSCASPSGADASVTDSRSREREDALRRARRGTIGPVRESPERIYNRRPPPTVSERAVAPIRPPSRGKQA